MVILLKFIQQSDFLCFSSWTDNKSNFSVFKVVETFPQPVVYRALSVSCNTYDIGLKNAVSNKNTS